MNRFSVRDRIGRRLARCVARLLLLFTVLGMAEPALAENTVTRWAEQSLQAVRAANVGTPNAGRLYAMVTVAMYDAVNGIDATRHRFVREYALVPTAGAPRTGSRSAAAAAAAHAVLVAVVPSQQAVLDAALAADLAAAQDGDLVAGEIWGRYVGEQVVALRATDGTETALPMPAGTAVGEHRAAFDARFRNMTPFGVRDIDRYRSGPPPALTSEAYAQAFNDVKTLGQQDGDAERNAIAQFWLVEGGTTREPGTWIQALVAIVEQMRTDRSLSDTARIFARVGMAIADGVAASWETKATFFTWRPFFAVREADLDGNPETDPDPTWMPRNISIGASPEWASGLSTFSGAASAVIEAFYFPHRVSFCFATDPAPTARCYNSPLAAAVEAGRSRIYQGIHFQFSNEEGRRTGRRIGLEVALTRLRLCFDRSQICLP
jgi:PAP2 superfamily